MRRSITIFFLLVCVFVLFGASASAQLLIEDFNYTTGDALTLHGWSAHSGAGTLPELVTATGLTYTGYASTGIGFASTLDSTGQDINKTWASYPSGVSSGNLYYSLMVNLSNAKAAGDYFFHLFKSGTIFSARIFAKKAANGNICFGIAKSSTAANVAYSDSIYSLNTTYLLVVKYSMIAGATNDTVALWVNPAIDATEPAPTVLESSADRTTADVDSVYGVAIRQGSAANAPKGMIDGIRVGTTWANSVYGTLEPKLSLLQTHINFGTLNVNSSQTDSITIQNSSAYATLNITSVTSNNPLFVVGPASTVIGASSSQKFGITYTPTSVSADSASIVFVNNDLTSPDTVFVKGSGVQAGFGAIPTTLNFGKVFKDSVRVDTVTVTNISTSTSLIVDSVVSSSAAYTVSPRNATLGIDSSAKFIVTFAPTVKGTASGNIVFYHNAPSHHDTVKVNGTGILKEPLFSATPTTKNYEVVVLGKSKLDSIVVKNVGYDSLIISNVVSSDSSYIITPTTARLDTNASQKYYITFNPTTVGAKPASIVFSSNVSEVTDTVKVSGLCLSAVSIAEARKDINSDLIADHSVTKDTLLIHGVVTSTNLQSLGSQTAIFIQDSTAGVEIFGYGLPPVTMVIGDSVFAIGKVSQYRGAAEFTPLAMDTLHFGIIKHNAMVPKPKHLSLHQYVTNAESFEGLLVEIDSLSKTSGTWPSAGTGASIYVTNASRMDTAQLYISSSTNVAGSIEPSYPINVVAVINQYSSASNVYNNGYEIEPSDSTNITKTKMTPIVSIAEARKDLNSDLIADHSVTHDTLQIFGVVTTPNLQSYGGSQTQIFIQDATAGIEVFGYALPATTYAIGDSVMVTGTVAQYRGLVEFTPLVMDTIHFTILKHNAKKPSPQHLTLHQYVTSAESYEGMLVEVDSLYKASGTWPAVNTQGKIYLTRTGTVDTLLMFTSSGTNLAGSVEKAYPINVVGVISQYSSASSVYNNGYELVPFDTSNIIHTPGTTGVISKTGIPQAYELSQNYPNPFNPSTTIAFGLPNQSHVTVKVYSILGQEITTLVDGIQEAGYHNAIWNGRNSSGMQASSGVYLLRVIAQSTSSNATFVQVRKMLLLK